MKKNTIYYIAGSAALAATIMYFIMKRKCKSDCNCEESGSAGGSGSAGNTQPQITKVIVPVPVKSNTRPAKPPLTSTNITTDYPSDAFAARVNGIETKFYKRDNQYYKSPANAGLSVVTFEEYTYAWKNYKI